MTLYVHLTSGQDLFHVRPTFSAGLGIFLLGTRSRHACTVRNPTYPDQEELTVRL